MNYALEYEICRQTIFYFIEEYLEICLREHQMNDMNHIINMDHSDHYEIITNRGDGTTTTIMIAALWTVLFNKNINVAFCGKSYSIFRYNFDIINELFDKFQERLPEDQRFITLEQRTSNTFTFSNNSKIYFIQDVENGLRGRNFEYIFVDNYEIPKNHAFMYNRVVTVRSS